MPRIIPTPLRLNNRSVAKRPLWRNPVDYRPPDAPSRADRIGGRKMFFSIGLGRLARRLAQNVLNVGDRRAACDPAPQYHVEPLLPLKVEKENVMRRVVLTLAALAVVSFAAGRADAGNRGRGQRRPSVSFGGHYQSGGVSFYAPTPYRGRAITGSRFHIEPFSQSVKRIQAYHSRYRYQTHPRSLYNGGPHPYDYFGR